MPRISIHEKGEFLADAVFAASDGIVTTFAVVAGSAGASFNANIILILGFANLLADGFSMSAGNYLGVKSEIEYEKVKGKDASDEGSPLKHAIVTFISFNIAGLVPLMPFILGMKLPFWVSTIFVGLALFLVGFLRSLYTKRNWIKSGVEIFVLGGFAAFVAFAVGFLIKKYLV